MAGDGASRVSLGIIAAILVAAALHQASEVFAPLALAAFVVAIVWPLQRRLQTRLPQVLALGVTLGVAGAVCLVLAAAVAWAFSHVGQSLVADAARYQALYERAADWLEGRGISVAGLWAEHFSTGWMLSAARHVSGQVSTTLSFWLIAFVYVMLGLLEVDDVRLKIERFEDQAAARRLIEASAATAGMFRKYMLVRTGMSLVTGLLVWALARLTGLQFAEEWGVIALVLNYIPFIGPFVATLFPTLLAMAQFSTWQAVIGLFAGLNVIQFVVGSYIEPRVSGGAMSISPFLVFFAVFFWAFLWGMFGAFIGDPIAIAILTFCRCHPDYRYIADLFGGPVEPAKA